MVGTAFVSHGSKPAVATESLPDGFGLVSQTISGSSAPAVTATEIVFSFYPIFSFLFLPLELQRTTRSKADHKKSKTGKRKRRIRELAQASLHFRAPDRPDGRPAEHWTQVV